MKKVLFIEPPPTLDWTVDSNVSKAGRRHPCLNETGEQTYSYQNLSCASVLRKGGFDVAYVHCPTLRFDLPMTEAFITAQAPFAVVIMVEHINASVAQAVSLHARKQGCRVLWVGPFVTALHEEEIKRECVDFILRGEWDYSVLDLLTALDKAKPVAAIAGCTTERYPSIHRALP
jgi:radical SAM superfamily enzyme YgiQ (UPF0313 family)